MEKFSSQLNNQVKEFLDKNYFDRETAEKVEGTELSQIFTSLRWNVLEWISFTRNDIVIELGANYGEFTSCLCDLVSQVYVYEPDSELAELIAKRCCYSENVSIYTGSFVDFTAHLPEKADKIIAHNIGIFKTEDELASSLKTLYQKFPDSLSIILSDNPNGIRYHYSTIITNSITPSDYLQLGKTGLEQLIRTVGYKQHGFYYLYPEAAYAMNLFSESFSIQKDSITPFNLAGIRKGIEIDDQEEYNATQQAIMTGSFSEETNSYLVLAGNLTNQTLPMLIKYSNQRADYYNIRTEIHSKEVRKIPLSKSGKRHIECIKRYSDLTRKQYAGSRLHVPDVAVRDGALIYPFISGNKLSYLLDAEFEKDKASFFNLLSEWRDVILQTHNNSYFTKTEDFIRIFGDVDFSPESRSGTVNNIDPIFDNIIVTDDGKWNVIDNEWSFEFPIPVKFILFRGLFYYLHYRKTTPVAAIQDEAWKLLDIDAESRDIFMEMDRNFIRYLSGNNAKLI